MSNIKKAEDGIELSYKGERRTKSHNVNNTITHGYVDTAEELRSIQQIDGVGGIPFNKRRRIDYEDEAEVVFWRRKQRKQLLCAGGFGVDIARRNATLESSPKQNRK